MAITVPTSDELLSFWGDEAIVTDVTRINLCINLAADLFWLASGIDADPTDTRLALLVKYAVLDMAIYMLATREDIDAQYSPLQSERIGSYTYSKQYQRQYTRMVRQVALNDPTGVILFDRIVSELIDIYTYANFCSIGEHVFPDKYISLGVESLGLFRHLLHGNDPADLTELPNRADIYSVVFGNADMDSGTTDPFIQTE